LPFISPERCCLLLKARQNADTSDLTAQSGNTPYPEYSIMQGICSINVDLCSF